MAPMKTTYAESSPMRKEHEANARNHTERGKFDWDQTIERYTHNPQHLSQDSRQGREAPHGIDYTTLVLAMTGGIQGSVEQQ